MTLKDMARRAERMVRTNSPVILSGIGVSGTITTAYLAGKASFQAAFVIQAQENEIGAAEGKLERLKDNTKLVWRLYIPAGISGVVTVACIIGATRTGNRRTAAVTAAYSLSEKALSEYREKVVEQFGINQEQKIRDAIAEDKVGKDAPTSKEVLVIGSGDILCCELYTGRYFISSMELLRRAQNDINALLLNQDQATLSDFYYLLGLPQTDNAHYAGWESYKLLELEFSTVLTEDNRPCIAFSYNYIKPK